MVEIIYKKGDIFLNTNPGDYLVHSCNAQASWRAGISASFAARFPTSHAEYVSYCNLNKKDRTLVGTCLLTSERIGCLITSHKYGRFKDLPDQIASSTYKAAKDLLDRLEDGAVINSPLMNAGLFGVPWHITENAITMALNETKKDIKWIVWSI